MRWYLTAWCGFGVRGKSVSGKKPLRGWYLAVQTSELCLRYARENTVKQPGIK